MTQRTLATTPVAWAGRFARHGRGVTLVELMVVVVISSVVLTGVVFLLVSVSQTNTNMMRDVGRMNDTDIAVSILNTYARDCDTITINSATDVTFTRDAGDYRLYLSGTTLLAITPEGGASPFTIIENVSSVAFTQPTSGLIRMVIELTWPDGMTTTRDTTVYCRNAT